MGVPVSTTDILPTLCDLLGIEVPATSRGMSLSQAMTDSNDGPDACRELRERPLFSESWDVYSLLDRSLGHASRKKVFTVRR